MCKFCDGSVIEVSTEWVRFVDIIQKGGPDND